MKHKIIPITELTDSREMLYAKEPNFFLIFMILIVCLLGSAFVWSWFSEMDIVVKSPGIVRPAEAVSSVVTIITGKISEIHVIDGKEVKKGDILYVLDTKLEDSRKGSMHEDVATYQRDIGRLRNLYTAIQTGKAESISRQDAVTLNRYMAYKYSLEQLTLAFNEAKSNYENEKQLFESNYSSKSKFEMVEREYRRADIALKKHTADTINTINDEMESKRLRLKAIRDQLDEVEIGIESTVIRAPIDGRVKMAQQFNTKEVVTAGTELLSIIPLSPDFMHVEIYLPIEHIGKIKERHHSEYRFAGYDYRDYNTGAGTISLIPADVSITQNGVAFYKLIGTLDTPYVTARNGMRGDIKIGMNAEVRIIVGKEKVFRSFIKKLNFWDDIYEPAR